MDTTRSRDEQDLTVLYGAYIMKEEYIKATKRIYKRHIEIL